MRQRIKKRVFEIVQVAAEDDLGSKVFDIFVMTLIALNVVAVILETVESLSAQYERLFHMFEIFSVVLFTIEYGLRVWTCNCDERFARPIQGRLRFILTPLALVDLMAILPFYLPMFISLDLRFLRAIRLLRVFRLLKMGRYSNALKTMGDVFRGKKEDLVIMVSAVLVLLVIASSLMYSVENEAQPDAFSSIPAAMWWAVSALTTVGYGDVCPVTTVGKVLGAVISVLGIGLFALPAGILASGFSEEIAKRRGNRTLCPHCGKPISGGSEY